jgi:hypothetical protein
MHWLLYASSYFSLLKEGFDDTKEVIRICKLKKNRQHNSQKEKDKRANNHLQNTTHKTKDRVTRNNSHFPL